MGLAIGTSAKKHYFGSMVTLAVRILMYCTFDYFFHFLTISTLFWRFFSIFGLKTS